MEPEIQRHIDLLRNMPSPHIEAGTLKSYSNSERMNHEKMTQPTQEGNEEAYYLSINRSIYIYIYFFKKGLS